MAVGLQTEINVAGAIPAGLPWSLCFSFGCDLMRRAKAEYKAGHMCIIHPGESIECHQLYDTPAHMFFEENGTSKLAIEHGSDWIDFEDSEFIGGSDTTLRVWGIPITPDAINDGAKGISPSVTSDADQATESDVIAWLFATVGHRVDEIRFEFPGARQIRIAMRIPDITEETDDRITLVTFDFKLGESESELERPV